MYPAKITYMHSSKMTAKELFDTISELSLYGKKILGLETFAVYHHGLGANIGLLFDEKFKYMEYEREFVI